MKTTYNRIAGNSLERLAALSDGIFAVAMTLLVLDIHVPEHADVHDEQSLMHALAALAPRFLIYLMSVMTIGIFWVGQQTQFNNLERAARHFTWIHILFLATNLHDAVFHEPARNLHRLPLGIAGLLAEYPHPRSSALRKLAICSSRIAAKRRIN